MQGLTASLEKLHTTDSGVKRIRRNLDLQNAETPELAISVFPEFRGYGIGTKLMKKLFEILQDNGYAQTSLSVQRIIRRFGSMSDWDIKSSRKNSIILGAKISLW